MAWAADKWAIMRGVKWITDRDGWHSWVAQLVGHRWTFYGAVEMRSWGVAVNVAVSGAHAVLGPFLVGAVRRRVVSA